MWQTDRQTDGRTDGRAIAYTRYSIYAVVRNKTVQGIPHLAEWRQENPSSVQLTFQQRDVDNLSEPKYAQQDSASRYTEA